MENRTDYRVGSPFAQEPPAASATDTPAQGDPVPSAGTASSNGRAIQGQQPAATGAPLSDGKTVALEPETLGHGVWTETAAAAAYSAVVLLTFTIACALIFPAGGIAVAALGAVLSLLGLSSRRVRLSVVTLVLHGVLFFVCYLRAI